MRKKLFLSLTSIFVFSINYAQVGVNTTDPKATLDITINNSNSPSNTDGLLIPRYNAFPTTNPTSLQHGMLIFLNVSITNYAKGFYYWDSVLVKWIGIRENNAWVLSGNTVDDGEDFIGSINDQDVVFKRDNIVSGSLSDINTSFGVGSLSNLSGGEYNTAFGISALENNTSGSGNVALGNFSLANNTTGDSNIGVGYTSLYNNISGSGNIGIGQDALKENTSGGQNLAIGQSAMEKNTTGIENIAFGYEALKNSTTGSWNTAIGDKSLNNNTTGYDNVGIGASTLLNTTTGARNLAIGTVALRNNTVGDNNLAIGYETMRNNTSGIDNLAIGSRALLDNSTGNFNAAIGTYSLSHNTTGVRNVAIGDYSLSANTTGRWNTAIGSLAFDSGIDYENSTAIGYDSNITASNQVRIGNGDVTSIGGRVNWTTLSDGRFKSVTPSIVPGLDLINKLRPVTYYVDNNKISDFTNKKYTNDSSSNNKKQLESGFIAQEVEAAAKSLGYEFNGVDVPKNDKDYYGLRYAQFVVPLVKAVQELDNKLIAKENENNILKQSIESLEKRLNDLEKKLKN